MLQGKVHQRTHSDTLTVLHGELAQILQPRPTLLSVFHSQEPHCYIVVSRKHNSRSQQAELVHLGSFHWGTFPSTVNLAFAPVLTDGIAYMLGFKAQMGFLTWLQFC